MRRHMLHIVVALLTFTVSFLFAGTFKQLAFALPAALIAFTLTKIIPESNIDPHYLKVGTITLLLWVVVAYLILTIFLPPAGSCVAIAYADDEPTIQAGRDERPTDNNFFRLPVSKK